jgi:hypothetical protein
MCSYTNPTNLPSKFVIYMDKIAYRHPVKIIPQLRYQHIMEIVQDDYNDFRRAQRQRETTGTNGKLQLKITSEQLKRIHRIRENPVKQPPKLKPPIQNSLDEFL